VKDLINYHILKKKYNIGLDFRKNIIKRLFCKHHYGTYTLPKKLNLLCESEHKQAVICSKCGKVKGYETIVI